LPKSSFGANNRRSRPAPPPPEEEEKEVCNNESSVDALERFMQDARSGNI
jgi:hypothetical protein